MNSAGRPFLESRIAARAAALQEKPSARRRLPSPEVRSQRRTFQQLPDDPRHLVVVGWTEQEARLPHHLAEGPAATGRHGQAAAI